MIQITSYSALESITPPGFKDHAGWLVFLEEGLDYILANRNLQTSDPYFTVFMNNTILSTAVYNYCTSKPPLGDTDQSLPGSELYHLLIRCFSLHVKRLRDLAEPFQDEDLVRYYSSEWLRYTKAASVIERIFLHLNRCWIERERTEGRLHIYPVYVLALIQWKENFFIPIHQKLTTVIPRLTENQGNGEVTNHLKCIFDSCVQLSFNIKNFDSDEDLQKVYVLLARIPDGLQPLREKFEKHVKHAIMQAAWSKEELHVKYSKTIALVFQGDEEFVASLDRACQEFRNSKQGI